LRGQLIRDGVGCRGEQTRDIQINKNNN